MTTLPFGGKIIAIDWDVHTEVMHQHFAAQHGEEPPPLSRKAQLQLGMVEPTAEEKAEQERAAAAYRAKREQEQAVLTQAAHALDAVTDPTWRAVLDLHQRAYYGDYSRTYHCEGCTQGCSCDAPSWPCATVRLAAERLGVPLPESEWAGLDRPLDGSLDAGEADS